jgi:hypothetical protein
MKPDSPIPHITIPLAHPRDNDILHFLNKNVAKDGAGTFDDIREFDRVVNVRDNADGGMCKSDAKGGWCYWTGLRRRRRIWGLCSGLV